VEPNRPEKKAGEEKLVRRKKEGAANRGIHWKRPRASKTRVFACNEQVLDAADRFEGTDATLHQTDLK
jgi:hypothetical protein